MRAQLRIPHAQSLPEARIEVTDRSSQALSEEREVIRSLGRVDRLNFDFRVNANPVEFNFAVNLVGNQMVMQLPLEGVVDLDAEGERLRTELADCDRNLERVETLVSNPNFRQKARPEVVENEEARLAELRERQQRLNEILQQLGR